MITWFLNNRVAANLLMFMIIAGGLLAVPGIKKEVLPALAKEVIDITVSYPGGHPASIESTVCMPLEEAIHDLDNIETLNTRVTESACRLSLELTLNTDVARMLDKVKTRVDGLSTLPEQIEQLQVTQRVWRDRVISVAVFGSRDIRGLKQFSKGIRDQLAQLPGISLVEIADFVPDEVSIEISDLNLQRYDLSLNDIAKVINQSSLDVPAGIVRSPKGDVRIRHVSQAYYAAEFAKIPLVTTIEGGQLLLGDIAEIRDSLREQNFTSRFDGENLMMLDVFFGGDQDVLDITEQVRDYVSDTQASLPGDIKLAIWRDDSVALKSRIRLLLENAAMGLALVFLLLVIFLHIRLAFWVCAGIIISFMGTLWLLPAFVDSIHMLTLFAFILVLGIVVDDAVVVGENIAHGQEQLKRQGKLSHQSAHQITLAKVSEVSAPVVFSTLTTIVAFAPLLFLSGDDARVARAIPIVVILTLLFSLVESLLILPRHLLVVHDRPDKTQISLWLGALNTMSGEFLNRLLARYYQPLLEVVLRNRVTTFSCFLSIVILSAGLVSSGILPTVFFPSIQRNILTAQVETPIDSHFSQALDYAERLENSLRQLENELKGEQQNEGQVFIQHIYTTVDEGAVKVEVELSPSQGRQYSAEFLSQRWRALSDTEGSQWQGAKGLHFGYTMNDLDSPINLELASDNTAVLDKSLALIKAHLERIKGVYSIRDNYDTATREVQLHLKPLALQLGLREQDLALQVRQGFYGIEAQRINREREDVRVMLRYKLAEREEIQSLYDMWIRSPDGTAVPLSQVAEFSFTRSLRLINRKDRQRIYSVTAAIDNRQANVEQIVDDFKRNFLPDLQKQYPQLQVYFGGAEKERARFVSEITYYSSIAIFVIYILMAILLGSYTQPLLVIIAIPFGLVGALFGHVLFGLELSLYSMMGMTAVVGVVVNDNLILIDYINRAIDNGQSLHVAVREAGIRRFRPLFLTSITTFVGLLPMILERSMQAQFLIPMAISLAFGVLFASIVTLLLVPALYVDFGGRKGVIEQGNDPLFTGGEIK